MTGLGTHIIYVIFPFNWGGYSPTTLLLVTLTGLCDVLRHLLLRLEGPLALQADVAGVVVGGGQAGLLPPSGVVAPPPEVLEEAAGGLAYEPKFGIRTDFCAKHRGSFAFVTCSAGI